MTYCPPNHDVQTYEFTALSGADVLTGSDTELGCGDVFHMPASATVCIRVTDNDGSLSGDARRNERGDDKSWQLADIEVDGVLVHDDHKIYAEEYYLVHDADGNCYHLVEIETACTHGTDADDFFAFVGDVPPPGAALTVAGKGNVTGNWIDYRELSAGLKWEPDADGKVTIEAEDMALRGYKVDDVHAASGGEVIRLKKAHGTASVVFGGEDGTYDLDLGYIDENDGQGSIEIWVNDALIHSIDLTADNDGNGGDWSSISHAEVTGILLSRGDEITLKGTRDAWEYARIDSLTFCESPLSQNAPPVALDDAYTVGETSSTVLDILANDFDPDSDQISLVAFTQPSEGSVRLDETGAVVFETGTDFVGLTDGQTATVTFRYSITDGNSGGITDGNTGPASATVTVTVLGEGPCADPVVHTQQATLPGAAPLPGAIPLPGDDRTLTVSFETPGEFCAPENDFSISVELGDRTQDQYNFVFVVDVSTSTTFANSFGEGTRVLDAEIAAIKALTADILAMGLPSDALTVSIIPFSKIDPNNALAPTEGLFEVSTFGDGSDVPLTQDAVDMYLDTIISGGETDYLAAVAAATGAVQNLESVLGDANNQVYFLSDGTPTPPGSQPGFLIEAFSTTLRAEATVHAIGLGAEADTTYLDPIDNTGSAEIVDNPAQLATSLSAAPFAETVILSATLRFLEGGAELDRFDFAGSDFTSTPLGYELDIASVAGLGIYAGQTTTALLDVALDTDGDGAADDTLVFEVDIDGVAPDSLDLV